MLSSGVTLNLVWCVQYALSQGECCDYTSFEFDEVIIPTHGYLIWWNFLCLFFFCVLPSCINIIFLNVPLCCFISIWKILQYVSVDLSGHGLFLQLQLTFRKLVFSSQECQSKHWKTDHQFKCKQVRLSDSTDVVLSGDGGNRRKSSEFRQISLVPANGTYRLFKKPSKVTNALFLSSLFRINAFFVR